MVLSEFNWWFKRCLPSWKLDNHKFHLGTTGFRQVKSVSLASTSALVDPTLAPRRPPVARPKSVVSILTHTDTVRTGTQMDSISELAGSITFLEFSIACLEQHHCLSHYLMILLCVHLNPLRLLPPQFLSILLSPLFSSNIHQILARLARSMYVPLPVHLYLLLSVHPLVAGNSPPPPLAPRRQPLLPGRVVVLDQGRYFLTLPRRHSRLRSRWSLILSLMVEPLR